MVAVVVRKSILRHRPLLGPVQLAGAVAGASAVERVQRQVVDRLRCSTGWDTVPGTADTDGGLEPTR